LLKVCSKIAAKCVGAPLSYTLAPSVSPQLHLPCYTKHENVNWKYNFVLFFSSQWS